MKRTQENHPNNENENLPLKQPKQEVLDEEEEVGVNEKLEGLNLDNQKKRGEKIVKEEQEDDDFCEIIEIPRKVDGNWCNLPVEIKELCFRDLDYQTRASLAQTCRWERFSALRKYSYHWKSLTIEFRRSEDCGKHDRRFRITAVPFEKNEPVKCAQIVYSKETRRLRDTREFSLLCHILKFGKIDTIRLEIGPKWKMANTLVAGLKSAIPFRFSNFWSYAEPEKAALFFVKNCETRIDRIHLFGHRFHAALNSEFWNFANVERFHKARHIQLTTNRCIPTLFSTIAQKWIDADVMVGTRLHVGGLSSETNHDFSRVFSARIRKTNGLLVRIATDNPQKHIVLDARPRGDCSSMFVIPAALATEGTAAIGWRSSFDSDGGATWNAMD